MRKSRLFFALPLILTSLAAGADPFLLAVRRKITTYQPFSVEFIQQVFIEDEMELEESGTILYQDHRHLKWQYQKPERKCFILRGDDYQFYQEKERQLIRGKIARGRGQLIWHFLFAEEESDLVTTDPRKRTIAIREEAGDGSAFVEIVIGPDFLPLEARQRDASGFENVFRFRKYRHQSAIAAGEFDLTVPPGTEIIEESAK